MDTEREVAEDADNLGSFIVRQVSQPLDVLECRTLDDAVRSRPARFDPDEVHREIVPPWHLASDDLSQGRTRRLRNVEEDEALRRHVAPVLAAPARAPRLVQGLTSLESGATPVHSRQPPTREEPPPGRDCRGAIDLSRSSRRQPHGA